ncbi:N-acetyltransferase [uncultured Erythrobacter sp.]|uniref:GNAT family N-acetyltransferase n=1 Tax=uncultured Erythrobacter sp. TaxID=263913 RepID=UPI0026202805|nr:GNAT family N-acetyltransferase [uncultured Erythrobacter sp.]
MTAITIHKTEKLSDGEYARTLDILRTFTRSSVPILDNHDFALLLKDKANVLVGGLIAQSRWGGFHIDILTLSEHLRGQGWGKTLLKKAETEARARKCHHMRLDTYAFQARAFYEAHGFEVFGQIDGPEPYYPHYFMIKRLG